MMMHVRVDALARLFMSDIIFSGTMSLEHSSHFLCSEILEYKTSSAFCHGHTYLGMHLEMQMLIQQTLTFTVKRKAHKSSILNFRGTEFRKKIDHILCAAVVVNGVG